MNTPPERRERRDAGARAQRDAVAAYFGIHPSHLASFPLTVIDVMAARTLGDRRLHAVLAEALTAPLALGAAPAIRSTRAAGFADRVSRDEARGGNGAELQAELIHSLFGIGLVLQATTGLTRDGQVGGRVDACIAELERCIGRLREGRLREEGVG